MIPSFKLFLLGLGTAVIVLLVQILFFPASSDDTLFAILLLTLIEETIRFLVLYFSERRDVLPANSPLVPVFFFGIAFALGEIVLSQYITPVHMGVLLALHLFLSVLIFLGIRPRKPLLTAVTYGFALALHLGYNAFVWFARL